MMKGEYALPFCTLNSLITYVKKCDFCECDPSFYTRFSFFNLYLSVIQLGWIFPIIHKKKTTSPSPHTVASLHYTQHSFNFLYILPKVSHCLFIQFPLLMQQSKGTNEWKNTKNNQNVYIPVDSCSCCTCVPMSYVCGNGGEENIHHSHG